MQILITGAGGLIGRELVGYMAERGHGVVAVQHRSMALHRNDGCPIAAAPWSGAPPAPGQVATLAGDVRRPGLGLDAATQAALLPGLDLVVHCAAVTSLDLVPIDHVVAGLADIAERMDMAAGLNFHLVSGTPVPVAGLTDLALGYPQLHAPRFVPPEAFDPGALTPSQQALHQQVTGLLASYLQRNPRFADANLRALSGRVCPPTDHRFLCGLIDYCLATGYIKGRRAEAA